MDFPEILPRSYNIIPPFSAEDTNQFTGLEEVKAAVDAVLTITSLNWPLRIQNQNNYLDLFDWLRFKFGFQEDNVKNQRENFIILLANAQRRLRPKPTRIHVLDYRAVDDLMDKLLKSYRAWCKLMNINHNLRLSQRLQLRHQRKILQMGLYLLIWGEASHLRYMPECLSYIFHHMAQEVNSEFSRHADENLEELHLSEGDSFLTRVVAPLYLVIEEEARKSKNGKKSDSTWCNYDDLNNYFCSHECFSLDWPISEDAPFFESTTKRTNLTGKSAMQIYLNTYRRFDRLWMIYVLALQAMVLFAWGGMSLSEFSTIFITVASLRFIQGLMDYQGRYRLHWWLENAYRILWLITLLVVYECLHSWYTTLLVVYILSLPLFALPSWFMSGIYVSRSIHGTRIGMVKYTVFAILLLFFKLMFSYFILINPMIEPTKEKLKLQDFSAIGKTCISIAALWSPVLSVYATDTHIWYTTLSILFGGLIGAFDRLRGAFAHSILKSRNHWLHVILNSYLVPHEKFREWPKTLVETNPFRRSEIKDFAKVWNDIISSIREEDLISNREMTRLQFPQASELNLTVVQMPIFLLIGKIRKAKDMACQSQMKDDDLWKSISKDEHMKFAVIECYETLKSILKHLVVVETEKRNINAIITEVESSISRNTLLAEFMMGGLPFLLEKFVKLLRLLGDEEPNNREVVLALQGTIEVITANMMVNQSFKDATPISVINSTMSKDAKEQIKRLCTLITGKRSASDLPANLKARRRIELLTESLVEMPRPPHLSEMPSFSVLTPFCNDHTIYSMDEITDNRSRDSVLSYLQKKCPDEWTNFLERINFQTYSDVVESDEKIVELRRWVSLKGQTLFRTVRGMMYFHRAVKLSACLDHGDDEMRVQVVSDMMFTCVITCEKFGEWMKTENPLARNICHLMVRFPSLRMAYLDEVLEGEDERYYYSVLVKFSNGAVHEIYRIKLPGPANIKPKNPSYAIIFNRGEAIQAYYMTQDKYLEEAFKICYLLEDFDKYQSVHEPPDLGFREQICTGCLASLGWMSNQETSFVTFGQRVLARPLESHFHYSHPDLIDRVLVIGSGCRMSSDDIFAGFCSTLRPGGDFGRSFGVQHVRFTEIYKRYSRSHFNRAYLWMFNVVTYIVYGERAMGYGPFLTVYMVVLAVSWVLHPFIYNPWAFRWDKVVDDWKHWRTWMSTPSSDADAATSNENWESWWEDMKHTGLRGRILSIAVSSRLFLYQYGVAYHVWGPRSVYVSYNLYRGIVRLLGAASFVSLLTVGGAPAQQEGGIYITVSPYITGIPAVLLASIPSWWAIVQIFLACRPIAAAFWPSVRRLAQWYDYLLGCIIFIPIALFSLIPGVSSLHTRLMFDATFRTDMHIRDVLDEQLLHH